MADQPTGTGQNLIIKNLNNILVALIITAIGGLFTWGINTSKTMNQQKDDYDRTIAELKASILAVEAKEDAKDNAIEIEVKETQSDIADLQSRVEKNNDDFNGRIIHLEDWKNFKAK